MRGPTKLSAPMLGPMTSVEGIVQRYYADIWSAMDVDLVAELLTNEIAWKTVFVGEEAEGHDTLYASMGALKAAFRDLTATLSDIVVEGESLTGMVRWTGTHTGHIWRTEGTGNRLDVTSPVSAQCLDGQLSRIVEALDWSAVRGQIGAEPPKIIELEEGQSIVPIMRTLDWDTSRRFYVRVLGFEVLFEFRYGPDFPVFAGLHRRGVQIHITEHSGDAEVGSSIIINTSEDVEQIRASAVAGGLAKANDVEDQPWGDRTFELQDPDGNRISFNKPGE